MFNTGKPVTGKDFYDRSAMVKNVQKMLSNGQSFIIKGPRRYGKTSLIMQVLADSKDPWLYLDLRRVPRIEMIAEKVVDFAYEQEGIKGFFKHLKSSAMTLLRENKQRISIDLDYFEYTIEFYEKEHRPCEMLTNAFDILNAIAKARSEHYVVVLDEFQDINRYYCDDTDILEVLRGVMQHHDALTYVFLGSIEHLMTQIFESKKSPFYQFARKLQIQAFNIDELMHELVHAFGSKQIIFKNVYALKALLEKLEGHPSNTMMVMQNIYYMALDQDIKLIDDALLDKAYEDALAEAGDLINQYISEIKSKRHNYDVLYRLIRNEEQELSGTRLNQVYNSLMEMGHIYRAHRGLYHVYDGFLVEYIKRI